MSAQQPIGPEKKAANDLDEAGRLIPEIRAEMEKAGIRDDDPIMPLLLGLIDLFERMRLLSQSVVGRLDGARAMVEAEIARMRAAIAASEAQTKKIEASVSSIDVRAHNLLTQTIDRMAAEVAGKMRERMVIVEERHNRFVLWRTGAFIAAVLLAAIGGGYTWRAYSDQTATTLLERCTASPFQDPSTGQLYCQFGTAQAVR